LSQFFDEGKDNGTTCTSNIGNRVFNIINVLFSPYQSYAQATKDPEFQNISPPAKDWKKKSKKLIKCPVFSTCSIPGSNFPTPIYEPKGRFFTGSTVPNRSLLTKFMPEIIEISLDNQSCDG